MSARSAARPAWRAVLVAAAIPLLSTAALQARGTDDPCLTPLVADEPPNSVKTDSAPHGMTGQQFLETKGKKMTQELMQNGIVVTKRISDGENGTTGMMGAVVLFERGADEVIRLLTQTERVAEYVSVLDEIRPIEKSANGSLEDHLIKVMLVRMRNRIQHEWDYDARTIHWTLDRTADNSFKHQEGFWRIYAFGPNRSVGEYGTRLDIGSFVPSFVQRVLTKRDLPESLGRLRAWVNNGGQQRQGLLPLGTKGGGLWRHTAIDPRSIERRQEDLRRRDSRRRAAMRPYPLIQPRRRASAPASSDRATSASGV